ncbi:glycoside hydrolase family 3 C-terminal domain-containing protein [Rhodococcus sp. OK519]|uniref:glycoside hydrolase family 3 C-terminal domain-containing protein n=1 Tax=Rhodococcus sp. OK519 TaxID=2135729 RepID=UPI000D3AD1A7
MTMREQVSLTSGADFWHTQASPGAGLPSVTLTDGPHGVRKQRTESGYSPESVPSTCFPTASALAATWDAELLEEVGVALGTEARTEGVSVLLGPGANIKRSALCGRNFEYFSEDPFLSSRIAAAWIRGVQATGVGASLKHFAVNNQEFRRYSIDALVDDRALREIYLASFEHAVTDARPATVMAAYNRVNGIHCTENRWLLTGVLREQWGFDGLVVSDWGAVTRRSSCLAAGLDLEMPGYGGRGDESVLAAVETGELSAVAIERAADAVTHLVERTEPARAADPGYDEAAHHTLARRAAEAGTVLLKNDGVLPLAASARVAVIGEFAKQPRYQGAGSSGINPHRLDDAWTDLIDRVGAERLVYAPGYHRGSGRTDAALLEQARAIAREADVAVVFAGLPDSYETEGVDRASLNLPDGHDALIAAVTAVCPRVVVVLANGAPVLMPWHDDVAAIVECYLGGQAAGSAISRILTGDAEPGGRLAETFPLRTADNPVHVWPTGPATLEYRESIYVGYRYYDAAELDVRYPFGHGLSYTSFVWSELEITEVFDSTADDTEKRFDVAVRITNTGDRPGSEVVQVYVRDVESTVFRPEQELAGFAKVFLVAGESRRVTIQVDRRAFAFWDTTIGDWAIESGDFEIRVGASSRDLRASATVALESDRSGFDPGPLAYHGSPVFERSAFAELYGKTLPDNVVDAPGHYTVDTPVADIRHPAATLLTSFLRRRVAAMAPTTDDDDPLSLLFERSLQELPPRMLPMLTQGAVTPDAAAAFVDICNGRGVRGIRALVTALIRR